MKFCYNCGAEIEDGSKFCVECGAELGLVDVGADNKDAERREVEEREMERREAERREAEKREDERREAEKREKERIEAERREKEQREMERREAERMRLERLDREEKLREAENKRLRERKRKKKRLIVACILSVVAIAAGIVSIILIKKYNEKGDKSGEGNGEVLSGKYFYGNVTIDYAKNGKIYTLFELNDIDSIEFRENKNAEKNKKYEMFITMKTNTFEWFSESGDVKVFYDSYLAVNEKETSMHCNKLRQVTEGDKTIRIEAGFTSDIRDDYELIKQNIYTTSEYRPEEQRFCFYDAAWNELMSSNDISKIEVASGDSTNGCIKVYFNEEGRKKYHEATKENIGRTLLFLVDQELVSAPYISSVIDEDSVVLEVLSQKEAEKIVNAFNCDDKYVPSQKHTSAVKEWCFNPEQEKYDFDSDRSNLLNVGGDSKVVEVGITAGNVDRAVEWEELGIEGDTLNKDFLSFMDKNKVIEVSYASSTGCIWLIIDNDRVDENFITSSKDESGYHEMKGGLHLPRYNNSRNIAQFTYDDIVRDTGEADPTRWGNKLLFEADGAWTVYGVRIIEVQVGSSDDSSSNDTSSGNTNSDNGQSPDNANTTAESSSSQKNIPVSELYRYFGRNLTSEQFGLLFACLNNVHYCFYNGIEGIIESHSVPSDTDMLDYMFAYMIHCEMPGMRCDDSVSGDQFNRIYSYSEVKNIYSILFDEDRFDELIDTSQHSGIDYVDRGNDTIKVWGYYTGDLIQDYMFYEPSQAYIENDILYIKAGNLTVAATKKSDGYYRVDYNLCDFGE